MTIRVSSNRGLPDLQRGDTLGNMRTLACVAIALTLAGCKTTNQKTDGTTPATAGGDQPGSMPIEKSRCDASGKTVTELDLNQDKKPDVWKYYAKMMDNGAQVQVLTCKEIDLNFDGKKDMWVYYDNGGNVTNEEYDLDFDGKIDLWRFLQNGHVVREEMDTNFDGKPDVWKFFEGDKVTRIERSSNKNGKVDIWEYYEGGKLDRIGYDTTGSGQIDKWDRAPDEGPLPSSVAQPAAARNTPPPTANTPSSTSAQAPVATPETTKK
jgi:hypothetical protein